MYTVWQQSDLSCNMRESSFCSPENVGEQGVFMTTVRLIKRKNHPEHPCQMCMLICSQMISNREPKTEHHKTFKQDDTNDNHPVNHKPKGGWDGSFFFWGTRSDISRQNGN